MDVGKGEQTSFRIPTEGNSNRVPHTLNETAVDFEITPQANII